MPRSLLRGLAARESNGHPPGAALNRIRALCDAIPPSAAAQLDLPQAHICRFSPDGRFLVCFAAAYQQLVVYQFLGATPQVSQAGHENFQQEQQQPVAGNHIILTPPQEAQAGNEAVPANQQQLNGSSSSRGPSSFERFFRLLYRVPIVGGQHVLCRDFALFPLAGRGGPPLVLLASHTPVIDPSRLGSRPTLPPAQVSTVPLVECTTLHLVNLETGAKLDSMSWDNDFVHLTGHAGVSLHGDLLSVLTVRSQQIRLIQILRPGSLVHVTSIGTWCSDEDELEARRAEVSQARWLEQQQQQQPAGRPNGVAVGRKRSPSPDTAALHSTMMMPLVGGLRRPPSGSALSSLGTGVSNMRHRRRPSTSGVLLGNDMSAGQLGGLHAQPQQLQGRLPAVEGQAGEQPHASGPLLVSGAQGLLGGRRASHSGNPGAGSALQAVGRGGPGLGQPAFQAVMPQFHHHHHGVTAGHVQGAPADGSGPSRGPAAATAAGAHQEEQPILPGAAGLDGANTGHSGSSRPPTGQQQRTSHMPPEGRLTPDQGRVPSAEAEGEPGGGIPAGNNTTAAGHRDRSPQPPADTTRQEALAAAGGVLQTTPSSTVITGLKQRLLAHMFNACLARAAAVEGGRTVRHQTRAMELRTFFSNWAHLSSLIVWRVQLVDRDLMLLDLGLAGGSGGSSSAEGAGGQQPISAGWQQTLYIALYNWQTTRMVCVLRSTSDAALALLHQYAPAMAADVTGAGDWERFASSTPSATAARELLAEALGPTARLSAQIVPSTAASVQGTGGQGMQLAVVAATGPAAAQQQQHRAGREGKERIDRQLVVRKALSLLAGGSQLLTASPFLDSRLFGVPEKLVPVASRARACPDAPVEVYVQHQVSAKDQDQGQMVHGGGAMPKPTRPPAFTLDPGPAEATPGRPAARRTMLLLAHPTQPFMMMVLSPLLGAAQSVLRVVYRSP